MAPYFYLDPPQVALVFAVLSFAAIIHKWHLSRSVNNPFGLPLPPGPPPRLIVGNIYDIPAFQAWTRYTDWGKVYGPLIHFRVFGQHFMIVNSKKIATDLFEKRSRIYSDRPTIPMVDLMGWDFALALMPYSDEWRKHRRALHQNLWSGGALAYRPTQMRKIHDLLQGLLSSPEDFMLHCRTVAAAIVMSTTYGYNIAPKNDHFVEIADQAARNLSTSVFPGAAAVNALPLLRHLPSWFPGAGFKRFAEETMTLTTEMQDAPFNLVKKNLEAGVASPCMVTELLETNSTQGGSKEQEDVIKRVAAIIYTAGADTTSSSIATFILAMVLHPTVVRKAQEEIDRVIGTHRLPDYNDRSSLPYVEAIYREVMRWRPALPLGVSRAASDNDIYNGYFIPRGTTIISNIWAMTRDESIYRKPELFNPDRFFSADGQLNDDATALAFGFGRRICVGRYIAEASVWGAIACILSTFHLAKSKDGAGKEIEVKGQYSDGMIVHPLPFQCSITPRSARARMLIQETISSNN